jgi:hypothetical protein
MKIKNVSGSTKTFQLGRRNTVALANNGTALVNDDPETMSDVLAQVRKNYLEVVEGVPASNVVTKTGVKGYKLITLDTVVDTDIITIAGVNFEFESTSGVTSGNVSVTIGANTNAAAAALKAAVNANATCAAAGAKINDVIDIATTRSILVLEAEDDTLIGDIAATESETTISIATAVNAVDPVAHLVSVTSVVPAAAEAVVVTGLNSISAVVAQVRTTAGGALVAYDGNIIINGGTIFFDDQGSVDLSTSVTLTVIAFGK